MKQITHAWLAFKAIERLWHARHTVSNQKYVDRLFRWFMDHRDSVIQGAWYPDAVIKDMATGHVLKFAPVPGGKVHHFRTLPSSSRLYRATRRSPLRNKWALIEEKNNLPDRCESISHSIIDNLKMIKMESSGSPVTPTNNHVALRMFMLSHYVADAHMPLHCDQRRFSEGCDIHAKIEGEWDKTIRRFYEVDIPNNRFLYTSEGFPVLINSAEYRSCYLAEVDQDVHNRKFLITWGAGNKNVWDFVTATCQHSYLMAYSFFPQSYREEDITLENWQSLDGQELSFNELSVICLSDAVDAIARIWLRVWRKYCRWERSVRE